MIAEIILPDFLREHADVEDFRGFGNVAYATIVVKNINVVVVDVVHVFLYFIHAHQVANISRIDACLGDNFCFECINSFFRNGRTAKTNGRKASLARYRVSSLAICCMLL